jgi:hypothetical protein
VEVIELSKIKGKSKTNKNAKSEYNFLYNFDLDFFEDDIVTGNEIWLHHYTPETFRQAMQ